jgi:hypothetical protein
MNSGTKIGLLAGVVAVGLVAASAEPPAAAGLSAPQTPQQKIDLAQALGAGKVRAVNRTVSTLDERSGIRLSAAPGDGVAWVDGTDFRSGTIEVDIRGKDVMQQSFVGVAFHRADDKTYEVVYLRPFNFRAEDPVRKQHAVQYMVSPEFEWPRLRKEFPEEFENPVDASLVPTDWVKLRVIVDGSKRQIQVGTVKDVTLEVRRLGSLDGGQVGLWVGNNSEGDFANLTITPGK